MKRLAQLRLGCLPLRIETDRYSVNKIPPEQRICIQPLCDLNEIENEKYFMISCKQYVNLRFKMYNKITIPGFLQFTDKDKFLYVLRTPAIAKFVGQFIVDAFDARLIK